MIRPNGVGETTLFKTIVGGWRNRQRNGTRHRHGRNFSYVDWTRAGIDRRRSGRSSPDKLDYIDVGQTEIPSRAYVSAFGFKGPRSAKPWVCSPAAAQPA